MASAAFSGYAVIATTGTAVQLRSTANTCSGGNILAADSNKYPVVVGPSTVTDDKTTTTAGYILAPGKNLPLTGGFESNIWYINGKATDSVTFVFHAS